MESKEGMGKYMENPSKEMKNHRWERGEYPHSLELSIM